MFVLQCEWLYIKIFEPMCSSRKSTIFTRRKEAKRYCFWLSENDGGFTPTAKFSPCLVGQNILKQKEQN